MMSHVTAQHGWVDSGMRVADGQDGLPGGATVFFSPHAPDRKTCGCRRMVCTRDATQEDLLCDECRAECRT